MPKCEDCIYLDKNDHKNSFGYKCTSPLKNFKRTTASYKLASANACRKCFRGYDGQTLSHKPWNLDVIKRMSPEKLAKIIVCPYESRNIMPCAIVQKKSCYECCLSWLMTEAEGGDNDEGIN